MRVDWENPVFRDVTFDDSEETGARKSGPLPYDEAIAYVAGDDPRPLLVLRECFTCSGTDDALLSTQGGNERTFVYTKWFNCVRLPATVTEADHPFHKLFPTDAGGAHLFIANADGSSLQILESEKSLSELWDMLEARVEAIYGKDAEKVYKLVTKLYMKLDMVDDEEAVILGQAYRELLRKGGDSKKLPKLRKKLAKVREERDALLEDEHELMGFGLKEAQAAE